MKPLKDTYTHKGIFQDLAEDMKKVYPQLDKRIFYQALVADLEQLELKARIERAADVCRQFLPKDYVKSLDVLYRFVQGKSNKLIYLFLPTYVAKYGKKHYEQSLLAVRDFTEYSSSEEGVRAFIELNPKKTLALMKKWTKSKNVHIRRLASEGCRSRLPWAKKISFLIENPELTWGILEALKKDSEKYVQKSVANHINDISKDHPDWVVKKVKVWDLSRAETHWIVKHGMRTLIKKGHKGALALFGSSKKPQVTISNIRWDKKVKRGNSCQLTFDLISKSKKTQSLIIDYKIHFCKKSGQQNPKTFKLTKCTLSPAERVGLKVKYDFRDRTTRKHYLGPHSWQLMINGELLDNYSFELQ